MNDWTKEFEEDRFNRIRTIAMEEQEKALAENARRYEQSARAAAVDDNWMREVMPELFGDEG